MVSQTNAIFNNAAQDAGIAPASPTQTVSLCSFYGTPGYPAGVRRSPSTFSVRRSSATSSNARHPRLMCPEGSQ